MSLPLTDTNKIYDIIDKIEEFVNTELSLMLNIDTDISLTKFIDNFLVQHELLKLDTTINESTYKSIAKIIGSRSVNALYKYIDLNNRGKKLSEYYTQELIDYVCQTYGKNSTLDTSEANLQLQLQKKIKFADDIFTKLQHQIENNRLLKEEIHQIKQEYDMKLQEINAKYQDLLKHSNANTENKLFNNTSIVAVLSIILIITLITTLLKNKPVKHYNHKGQVLGTKA